jgi:Reverse transcriptase (RNA-dependent DNA polymerase)
VPVTVNSDLILWCANVLQPARPEAIARYVAELFPEVGASVDSDLIRAELLDLEKRGWVIRVVQKNDLFSVTSIANKRFGKSLRLARDSARLFLLRGRLRASFSRSGESFQKVKAGDSPSSIERPTIEGTARPIDSAAGPRTTRPPGRIYSPRTMQQRNAVGSEIDSPDFQLRYGSFANFQQVAAAAGARASSRNFGYDELALCIGVSPGLLRSIVFRKARHYRRFTIPKRSGGIREILAPRVYLKTIQKWIANHIIEALPVHDACHSFRPGRSIISNAEPHIGQQYVGCIDIKEFFPSLSKAAIEQMLLRRGVWPSLAHVVSSLSTLGQRLPQGAPSSSLSD